MGVHLCVGEAHVNGNKASGLAMVCVSLWGLVRGEGLSASIGVCVWAHWLVWQHVTAENGE